MNAKFNLLIQRIDGTRSPAMITVMLRKAIHHSEKKRTNFEKNFEGSSFRTFLAHLRENVRNMLAEWQ